MQKLNADKIFNIATKVFYAIIIFIVLLLVVSMFPIKGNIQIKIVQSGSMEPAIKTGSIVVIKPSANYAEGDVVTFGKDTKTEVPTTHRVVATRAVDGEMLYTTKGDANEDADVREVRAGEIHGKVVANVPYLGFIIDFARKPAGFVVFIVIPALMIIYDEVVKIVREIKKMRTKKNETAE